MKQAWFMENSEEDQRLPHHRNPKQFVSLDYLSGFSLSFSPLSSPHFLSLHIFISIGLRILQIWECYTGN